MVSLGIRNSQSAADAESATIRGRFCECDNANCPLNHEGKMCSGQGACECGKCLCEQGFTGDDCGCSDDPAPCTENGVVCSGNGVCECGKCACNVGYTGATCNVEENPQEPQEDAVTGVGDTSSSEEVGQEHKVLPAADDEGDQQHGQLPDAEGQHGEGSDAPQLASATVWLCLLTTALAAVVGAVVL
ncbi:EGF-like domain containing protein [Aphelenchoides avenae]|nr:EGF-like domain containing protein [Aphelenchus avenae]KAH7714863.1 EGF-like domain containing protein [Aphelenchus avenae]